MEIKPTLIKSKTPYPLKLLVIDGTLNINRWEYNVSKENFDALKSVGLPVVSNDVYRPNTFEALADCFKTSDFSAVLYFAHGNKNPNTTQIDFVQVPQSIVNREDLHLNNWYFLSQFVENLEDKFIAFCVCDGFCQDMINTFVKGDLFALTVVAPRESITSMEAKTFFPAFYKDLYPKCTKEIDPNDVRDSMCNFNYLTNGKMKIFSDGLSVEQS